MKVKIVVWVLASLLVAGAGVGGGYYYNATITRERVYLQERIALLHQENRKLKKEVSELEEKNEKALLKVARQEQQEIRQAEQETAEQAQTDPDINKIKEAARQAISQDADISLFKTILVRKSGIWATATAVPKDASKYESYFLVLKKQSGSWKVLDSGSGITQENYPDSPGEIWQ